MRTLTLLSEKHTELNTTPGDCENALRDRGAGKLCNQS